MPTIDANDEMICDYILGTRVWITLSCYAEFVLDKGLVRLDKPRDAITDSVVGN
jgi:hypothetical protein